MPYSFLLSIHSFVYRDVKLYSGSTAADIPPAKSDRDWIAACKTADSALKLSTEDRIERYWHEFPVNEEDEGDASDGNSEASEMEVCSESPKLKRDRKSKKHRRIIAIDSESDEESPKLQKQRSNKEDDMYSPTGNGSVEETESSDSPVESEELSEDPSDVEEEENDTGINKKKLPKASVRGSSIILKTHLSTLIFIELIICRPVKPLAQQRGKFPRLTLKTVCSSLTCLVYKGQVLQPNRILLIKMRQFGYI